MNTSKKTKNISTVLLLGAIILSFAIGVSAQTTQGGTSLKFKIENPFKVNTIEGLIRTIVNDILMPVGGVVAVVMVIYAGLIYTTARGNPEQIKKAHKALLWAVVGAAILLGAWVITTAITATVEQLKVP